MFFFAVAFCILKLFLFQSTDAFILNSQVSKLNDSQTQTRFSLKGREFGFELIVLPRRKFY